MTKLSKAAESALINARAARVGASIGVRTPAAVILELKDAGMIGPMSGLTELGVIARDSLLEARLQW